MLLHVVIAVCHVSCRRAFIVYFKGFHIKRTGQRVKVRVCIEGLQADERGAAGMGLHNLP